VTVRINDETWVRFKRFVKWQRNAPSRQLVLEAALTAYMNQHEDEYDRIPDALFRKQFWQADDYEGESIQ
jgi:hypothetical protein